MPVSTTATVMSAEPSVARHREGALMLKPPTGVVTVLSQILRCLGKYGSFLSTGELACRRRRELGTAHTTSARLVRSSAASAASALGTCSSKSTIEILPVNTSVSVKLTPQPRATSAALSNAALGAVVVVLTINPRATAWIFGWRASNASRSLPVSAAETPSVRPTSASELTTASDSE